MKLAIMQPYFFPYLGYFSLIRETDEFILFDTPQFIRHGWIERNRILKQGGGWQYIGVPLKKHSRETAIRDICIAGESDWKARIAAQLQHYRKKAPFYRATMEVVGQGLAEETDSIAELDRHCLEAVCAYLDIPFRCRMFSSMDLAISPVNAPDEWALNICRAIPGVTEYWNPPGGMAFFDRTKYQTANLGLVFQRICLQSYPQGNGTEEFIAGLSVIDAMMFNEPARIREMLGNYDRL